MQISKAVGIDLGTTRSLIGIMDADDREIYLWKNKFKQATIPSVVQWDENKKGFKVGHEAVINQHQKPYPVRSIKRNMGYANKIPHNGVEYSPEEISAEILKFLKSCGEELVKEKMDRLPQNIHYVVDRAIVTVPAYFDNTKIEATRKAAEMAGLKTLELLNEPTAAAVYFCWKKNIPDGNFMVYDLGGGTFDVSVLRRSSGSFEILGTAGDNVLGGDTFDKALAEYIIGVLNEGGYNLNLNVQESADDAALFDYFVHRAEGIKTTLTDQNEALYTDTSCPFKDKEGKSIIAEMKITRPQFLKLIEKHLLRTIEISMKAIEIAKEKALGTFKGLEDIDYILLVGGSTYIPAVRKMVQEAFCAKEGEKERAKCVNVEIEEPDECVALGAALLAAATGGIIFHDEQSGINLHLEGAAIVGGEEYKARGRLYKDDNGSTENSPFAGHILALSQDGEALEETEIDNQGHFRFEEVGISSDGVSHLAFTLKDGATASLVSFSRFVSRGQQIDNDSTAVNSQDVWIYTRGSKAKMEKTVVVKASEKLPYSHEFSFTTTDEKQVLFIIHQGEKEIRKASQTFTVPQGIGTRIQFSMSMDKQGNMIVRSMVGDEEPYVMQLDAMPPEPFPTIEEIEAKHREVKACLQELPAGQRRVHEMKVKRIVNELETGIRQGDGALINERMQELKSFLTEVCGGHIVLSPPHEEFDELAQEIRQLIDSNRATLNNPEEQLKNLDVQITAANTAYKEKDQQALNEALAKTGQLKKYIKKQLEKIDPPPDPPLQFLVPRAARYLIAEIEQLCRMVDSAELKREGERHIEDLERIPMIFASDEETRPYIPTIQAAFKFKEKVEKIIGRSQPVPRQGGFAGIPGL